MNASGTETNGEFMRRFCEMQKDYRPKGLITTLSSEDLDRLTALALLGSRVTSRQCTCTGDQYDVPGIRDASCTVIKASENTRKDNNPL